MMRTLGLFLLICVFFSCGSRKKMHGDDPRVAIAQKDSTVYELIIFDPGFDSWVIVNNFKYGGHSNEYYQSRNAQYAQAWNIRFASGDNRIQSHIDYDTKVNYDNDFNSRLYLYFKYFEEVNRIKLIP